MSYWGLLGLIATIDAKIIATISRHFGQAAHFARYPVSQRGINISST